MHDRWPNGRFAWSKAGREDYYRLYFRLQIIIIIPWRETLFPFTRDYAMTPFVI